MTREILTPAPAPSHYRTAARLLGGARMGSLATRLGGDGLPYASLVTVATDHDGCPVLLLSTLADHTQALLADHGRAALLIEDAGHLDNPQTGPRVSLMGRARRLDPGPERDRAAARFLARHPGAALYAGFGDFAVWKLVPERAHLVGGFARAVWLEGAGLIRDSGTTAAFAAAEAELVAATTPEEAAALASGLAAGLVPGASQPGVWRMAAIDGAGVTLRNDACERTFYRAFDPPVEDPSRLWERLSALVGAGRADGPPQGK